MIQVGTVIVGIGILLPMLQFTAVTTPDPNSLRYKVRHEQSWAFEYDHQQQAWVLDYSSTKPRQEREK